MLIKKSSFERVEAFPVVDKEHPWMKFRPIEGNTSISITFADGKTVMYSAYYGNTYFDIGWVNGHENDSIAFFHNCSIFHPGEATEIANDYHNLDSELMKVLGDDYNEYLIEKCFRKRIYVRYQSGIGFKKSAINTFHTKRAFDIKEHGREVWREVITPNCKACKENRE